MINLIRRFLTRVGAALALLAAVVGIPIGLYTFGHTLIPGQAPSLTQIWVALTTPDNGRVIAAVMLIAGTLAWASFTLSVITELAARIRHRPTRRLPGLKAPQLLAATLIGLIVSTSTPVTASTAAADTWPPLPSGPVATRTVTAPPAYTYAKTSTPKPATPALPTSTLSGGTSAVGAATALPASAGPTWTVRKGDTLWAIAERTLGDPLRFPEIVDLNTGRTQPDGRTLTSADWLQIGWTLTLPADAHLDPEPADATATVADGSPVVVVEPGDTLSEIAVDHHADVAALWAVNAGSAQPGGRTLTDPNHIEPGWTITIPPPAASTPTSPMVTDPTAAEPGTGAAEPANHTPTAPAPVNSAPPTVDQPVNTAPPTVGQPVNPQVNDPARTAGGGLASAPALTSSMSTSTPATVSSTSTTAPLSSVEAVDADTNESADEASSVWAVAAGGAALLAGGLLLTMVRLRRRQARHRRPGRVVTRTPDQLTELDRTVRSAGEVGHLEVGYLDMTLRRLLLDAADTDLPLPDVIAARLSTTDLELVLHHPHTTTVGGWKTNEDGTRWTLTRTDTPDLTADERGSRVAPYPALVSVGHTTTGDHWLLDLERIGTLRITGDLDRAANLGRFIAAELAHHPWSEILQISILTGTRELADLNPERLSIITPARTRDVLRAAATRHADVTALRTDALEVRRDNEDIDTYAPHVLIVDTGQPALRGLADDPDWSALTRLDDNPSRTGVAVVLLNPSADREAVPGRWVIDVDVDGGMTIDPIGVTGIAEQLPAAEAAQLGQLLAYAGTLQDAQAANLDGDQPWMQFADELGNLRDMPGVDRHRTDTAHDGNESEGASSLLPAPPRTYTTMTATTARDVNTLAPTVTLAVRHQVESVDPGLDADLADWYDPDCPRPKIRVLGPIEVTTSGVLPHSPQLDVHTEAVAYLATRPHGVTAAQFGAALWPDENLYLPNGTLRPKVRGKLSTSRKWLGDDPDTGRPYLTDIAGTRGGVYRLEHHLVDADLLQRLRTRATSRGADGIPDLHAALKLVAGIPYDQQRLGGYGWLAEDPLDRTITATIVDTAHLAATHHLAHNEPYDAVAAAKIALLAGAYDDTTRLDLIHAYRTIGNTTGADLYLQQLLTNNNAEVEEDLPPRTLAILDGRL